VQSQTKACIAKFSYEVSALLRYYAALSGNSLPTFWDSISIPSSRVKKSKKKEWNASEVGCHNFYFWDFVCCFSFLKKHNILEPSFVSIFRQRST